MEDDGQASLSPQKLLQFALDVAKGMQHLAASGASIPLFFNLLKKSIQITMVNKRAI